MDIEVLHEALSAGRQAKIRIDGKLFYLVPDDERAKNDLQLVETNANEYPIYLLRKELFDVPVIKPSNQPAYTRLAKNRWSGRK